MHTLTAAVQAAFAPQGVLSRAEALFLPREGQTRMALAVAQAARDAGCRIVALTDSPASPLALLADATLLF
ncbi:hypothetical protein ABXL43_35070, partial [Burkholderia sola]